MRYILNLWRYPASSKGFYLFTDFLYIPVTFLPENFQKFQII